MGKLEWLPSRKHDNKPSDVTLPDGQVVKSIQYTEDPNEKTLYRVIDFKKRNK